MSFVMSTELREGDVFRISLAMFTELREGDVGGNGCKKGWCKTSGDQRLKQIGLKFDCCPN